MIKDKKKLARVIATWVVTTVMLSVFILDIIVVALGNKYVNEISIFTCLPAIGTGGDQLTDMGHQRIGAAGNYLHFCPPDRRNTPILIKYYALSYIRKFEKSTQHRHFLSAFSPIFPRFPAVFSCDTTFFLLQ